MTLRLQEEASSAEDLHLSMRFKRAGDRYIVELFPGVEFDVQEPTAEAFEPVLDLLFEELTLHYDRGLDLFLENRVGKLRIPFSPPEPKPPRPSKGGPPEGTK
jgi:hypothetical protein